MDDLYFQQIKILPTYTNSIVCRNWYNKLREPLMYKRIDFFDLQLYNLINSKCACYIRYKYTYDNKGFIDRENIDDGNNKLFINAYNKLIYSLMDEITRDIDIVRIIGCKMIHNYRKMMGLYKKYKLFVYNFTDRDIAEEYKMLLIKYYDYSASMLLEQQLSSISTNSGAGAGVANSASARRKLNFEEE
jgi:hypothetical protein